MEGHIPVPDCPAVGSSRVMSSRWLPFRADTRDSQLGEDSVLRDRGLLGVLTAQDEKLGAFWGQLRGKQLKEEDVFEYPQGV